MTRFSLRPSRLTFSFLALAVTGGCGEGVVTPVGGDSTSSGVGGGTVSSSSSAGGSAAGGGGALLPDGCYDALASDVTLHDVSFYQVVEVPALLDGQSVSSELRPAPLVQGRPALVRVGVDVADGFVARELGLRVTVTTPSEVKTHLGRGVLAADSTGDPSTGLRVELPSDAMAPDARYVVSVVECEAPSGSPSDGARFPRTGEAELDAIEVAPLKIHMIPFEVNGFVPDTSPAVLEGMRDRVYSVYPVSDVQITVAPVRADFAPSVNVTDLLVATGVQQEQTDQAPADVYYYGLYTGYATREAFNVDCGCSTGSSQELFHRAGFAAGAAFGDARAEDTLIHELGHLHGLIHAPCGEPANVDPLFPHPQADIDGWGWDVRAKVFVPSDHKDMMSYCYPRWISAYNYDKLASWMTTVAAPWTETMSLAPPSSPPAAHHCGEH